MSKKWNVFQSTEEYLAQVAHDAKAPITALKVALKSKANSQHSSDDDVIKDLSAQAMTRLENILSELRSPGADGSSPEGQPTNFEAKASVATIIEKIVREKKALLNFDMDREVKITQKVDSLAQILSAVGPTGYLERCLSNIIDNAIEATPMTSPVKIKIEAVCENGEVTITVTDNGLGIPEQIISLIGRTPITYRKEGGTGRGLYFVHRFLQSMDGALEISQISKGLKRGGTCVSMRIPLLH